MIKKVIQIISLILITSTPLFSKSINQTQAGVFDFSNADLSKPYSLVGQWEFYWKKFYTSEDFKNKNIPINTIKVNGSWNQNSDYTGDGYGTYRILIIVPHSGNYTLKFHQILSAYRVYINGTLTQEIGIVDSVKSNYKAIVRTNSLPFYTNKDTNEIILHVVNYSHRFGGIQEKVIFGKTNIIQRHTSLNLLYLFFGMGAEFIFALYFFFSFFFRQKDPSYIYFSIAIVITIMFGLVNNEMVLLQFIPNMHFEIQKKIDFFSNYSRLTFFTIFLWYTFKEYKIFNKGIFNFILLISALLSILVLVTNCKVYSNTLIPFEILILTSFIYFMGISIYGLKKKVPYIIYTFVGLVFLNTGMINDILTSINVINTPYIMNYALLLFFISHSITLSLKYSSSNQQVSILTSNFKTYEQILQRTLKIFSYDLEKLLGIIKVNLEADDIKLLTFTENEKKCECKYQIDKVVCSKGNQEFQYDIKDSFINQIIKTKENLTISVNNSNYIYCPIFENDELKAIIILVKNGNTFPKSIPEMIDMLSSQISTFIDNYTYYYKLQNLNANLENTIEKRTQEIYNQKKQLQDKNEELAKKIEELNISSKIVEDLNIELDEIKKELKYKNNALEKAKKFILKQKSILEENSKYINQSILYAKKIQNVLYSEKYKLPIKNSFILDSPKEFISGDLVINYYEENHWLLGVIDTTSINVSSVFIRLFIYSILDDIFHNKKDIVSSPSEIIKVLRYEFLKGFSMFSNESSISLQFDICLARVNFENADMLISSSKFPAVIIRQNDIISIHVDNFPIGDYLASVEHNFEQKKYPLEENDSIYIFTDGFYNQLNKSGKKYTQKKFHKLLQEIDNLEPELKKKTLENKLLEWKSNFKRVDDFTIIGFKYTKQ